jgi:hypothetical protein
VNLGYDIGGGGYYNTTGTIGSGGTLVMGGAGHVILNNKGTNSTVSRVDGGYYISDNSNVITDGYYIAGNLFSGTVVNVSSGSYTGSGVSYSSNVFTISDSSKDYIIDGTTTSNKVTVSAGTSAATDVIMFGTSISITGSPVTDSGSKVNMELCGVSTLSARGKYAGLEVPSGSTLTISGTGSLTASGGVVSGDQSGAGIGGGYNSNSGTINIASGTVTATGGSYAAGIGGGAQCAGIVSITGGTVTATGGQNSAGIGGGYAGGSSTITISGGTVNATGGSYASGIGSGMLNTSASGSSITISGDADVTAVGGQYSAGIGGGTGGGSDNGGGGGTISITGGTVNATS